MYLQLNKTDEEITADILREVPENYQKSVGFWLWDLFRAVAKGALKPIYDYADYICQIFFDISKMEYGNLVKFVFQRRGIVARVASYSTGSLEIVGNGTVAKGDLFETPSKMQFQAIETKEISGVGNVLVECLTAGMVGNIPAGAVTAIPIVITGIISAINPDSMTGGYDAESKESIIERYLEDIQRPITSANKYHYIKWAKEVTGVGNVKVKPLWQGDNTVKVVIVDTDCNPAEKTLVNNVQKYIDPYGYLVSNGSQSGYVQDLPENYENQHVASGTVIYTDETLKTILTSANGDDYLYKDSTKKGWGRGNGQAPVGAYCTVESAVAKRLNIANTLALRKGANFESVLNEEEGAINTYLKSTVFNDTYISYVRVGACILSVDNVLDYSSLTINGASDNIELEDSDEKVEIAILGELNAQQATKEAR